MLIPITLPLGLYLFTIIQPQVVGLEDTSLLTQISAITIVLIIPALLLGYTMQKWNKGLSEKLLPKLKIFSLTLIGLIIVVTLFKNRAILAEEIVIVFPMTFLFNALLLSFGFWMGKLLQFPISICRTISLELGIQNIGIALIVVPTLFPDLPTVLNIVAFWGVWHLITGLIVSHYWLKKRESIDRV